jgi:hypothetical protein
MSGRNMLANHYAIIFFYHGATAPSGLEPSHYRGCTITLRHTTLCATPLDEGSAQRRDLFLTRHSTQKRQTSMPPAGFESATPASELPQNHALDRAVTGIGSKQNYIRKTKVHLLVFSYFMHLIIARNVKCVKLKNYTVRWLFSKLIFLALTPDF